MIDTGSLIGGPLAGRDIVVPGLVERNEILWCGHQVVGQVAGRRSQVAGRCGGEGLRIAFLRAGD